HPPQVPRTRARSRDPGARGLPRQMGPPPILSPARLRQARRWAGQGLTHAGIGLRLGVSRSRISELIKQHGTLPAPDPLFEDTEAEAAGTDPTDRGDTAPGQHAGTTEGEGEQDTDSGDGAGTDGTADAGGDAEGDGVTWRVAARIESGTVACRYAGAMLVHAFTDRIGARGLLTAGTGASGAGADDLGILVCTQMSFT